MLEKAYRGLIAVSIVFFALRLVTEIRVLAVFGALLIIIAGFIRIYIDAKAGKFKGKKKKNI